MKQTAVEWLVEQLTVIDKSVINKTYLQLNKTLAGRHLSELIEQAEAMEKEQIGYTEFEVLQLLLKLKQTESYDNLYDWFQENKKQTFNTNEK